MYVSTVMKKWISKYSRIPFVVWKEEESVLIDQNYIIWIETLVTGGFNVNLMCRILKVNLYYTYIQTSSMCKACFPVFVITLCTCPQCIRELLKRSILFCWLNRVCSLEFMDKVIRTWKNHKLSFGIHLYMYIYVVIIYLKSTDWTNLNVMMIAYEH